MQKEKVDIDDEKSAQISIVAKKTNTKITPNYDLWSPNKLHITIILLFFRYYVHIMLLI